MSREMFVIPNKPLRIYDPASLSRTIELEKWWVQPKWNGHRALPFCDAKGGVIVYSRHGTPLTRAKTDFKWLSVLGIPRPWELDGELLIDGRMIVWDIAVIGGEYVFKKPYAERFALLKRYFPKRFKKEAFSIEIIESLRGPEYKKFMLMQGDTHLEGFVFKNPEGTDHWGPYKTIDVPSQLKYRF